MVDIKQRYPFHLPDDLYDEVMDAAGGYDDASGTVETAVRFWLSLAKAGDTPLPPFSDEHELIARRFIHLLRSAPPKLAQAMILMVEAWFDQQNR